LIASSRPEQIAAFQVSESAKQMVAELISREKYGELTPEETVKLDDYLQLEHIMRLAKARARQLFNQG
jgi:hypothetical protein